MPANRPFRKTRRVECGDPQKLDTLELVLARFFVVFRVLFFWLDKATR